MNRLNRIALTILAVALFTLPVHAQQEKQTPGSGIGVAAFSDKGQEAAFEVPVTKNYPDAPYVIVWQAGWPQQWMQPNRHPQMRDGRLVSGFKISGWMEDHSAKIIVTALVNQTGKEFASTKERDLEEQFVETYLVKVGDVIRVSDMAQYGVKPLELRGLSAKSLFPPKPASTVAKPNRN